MKNELSLTEPYQTDDNTPTLTLVTGHESIAFPYHLVRSMQLGDSAKRIVIDLDDQTVTIAGSKLGKLWRELRAYRIKEISPNAGEAAKAVSSKLERAIVEDIAITLKEEPQAS